MLLKKSCLSEDTCRNIHEGEMFQLNENKKTDYYFIPIYIIVAANPLPVKETANASSVKEPVVQQQHVLHQLKEHPQGLSTEVDDWDLGESYT